MTDNVSHISGKLSGGIIHPSPRIVVPPRDKITKTITYDLTLSFATASGTLADLKEFVERLEEENVPDDSALWMGNGSLRVVHTP